MVEIKDEGYQWQRTKTKAIDTEDLGEVGNGYGQLGIFVYKYQTCTQ